MGTPRWVLQGVAKAQLDIASVRVKTDIVPSDLLDHLRAQDVVAIALQRQIDLLTARIVALERKP